MHGNWSHVLLAPGPFGPVQGLFGVRSGFVRIPFEARSGSVRTSFRVRSGSVRDPFGVRSGSICRWGQFPRTFCRAR